MLNPPFKEENMTVEERTTETGILYLLIDGNNNPVDEVNRYLCYLHNCGKSHNTIRSYAFHLKLYYQYLSLHKLNAFCVFDTEKLKPLDLLTNFMFWLQYPNTAQGLFCINKESCKRSNSSVNTIMGVVLSFYQYLVFNNEIADHPILALKRNSSQFTGFLSEMMKYNVSNRLSILKKPVPPTPVESVTRDQYLDIIRSCQCRRDQLLVALMFEGGLRLSEALGLHMCDLDQIEDGIIKIVPRENNENKARVKNYAGGVIAVPQYVISLCLEYILNDIGVYDSDFLFLTLNGKNRGHALKADTVEKLFLRLSDSCGYKVHPHMLRHGFATEKLNAGWQMVDIQAYLRHKSLASTQIYASYSDELKKQKMRVFFDTNSEIMGMIANEIR